jgi:hypothetical protein
MSNYLTVEDIRHWIFDRTVDDNPLEMDIFYDDEEIKRAMRYACTTFNSIPPRTVNWRPDRMPLHDAALNLTVYHLYLSKISMLSRNDIDYNAGGVTATEAKRQMENLKQLMMMHKAEGESAAKNLKVEKNIMSGFAIFC